MSQVFAKALFFAALFLSAVPLPAAVLRVPGDFAAIQPALDAAGPGDTVLLSDGVYSGERNVDLDFRGKPITLRSENGPEATVIDCQGLDRGVSFVNGETGGAVLSGLTIRNGNGDGAPPGGGAVLCLSSSPIIEDCRFEGCCAALGGALRSSGGAPLVRNCVFQRNVALESGGGAFLDEGSEAVFHSSTFLENQGGGIGCRDDGTRPRFLSCHVSSNASSVGQVACEKGTAPYFERCAITLGTGALYCSDRAAPQFTTCLLAVNSRYILRSIAGSSPRFLHCTMAVNSADLGLFELPTGDEVVLDRSLVWQNSGPLASPPEGRFRLKKLDSIVQFLDEQVPYFVSIGNYDFGRFRTFEAHCGTFTIPDFLREPGDFHLRANTPPLDASPADTPLTDLDGNYRPCGAASDLGAYESGGCPPPSLAAEPAAVEVGYWGRELVAARLLDGQAQPISGAAVDFVAHGPGAIRFPYPRAYTGADGYAYTVLEATLPEDPRALRAAFTVLALGMLAGPVPVTGSNVVSDGPIGFQAPPLAPFSESTQALKGTACGFVSPETVGNPVGAWSIDPGVAEIRGGVVTEFREPCVEVEFEVVAHRAGAAFFIIGMVDLPIYQAEVRFDPTFRRGDSNADDSVDLSDPVNTLDVLFRGQGKIPCRDAADSNDDGTVDLSDPIHSLGFLFLGEPAPPPPTPFSCGPDPTADVLACNPPQACR